MDIVQEIKKDLESYIGEYESVIDNAPFLAKVLFDCDKGIKNTPHITSAIAFLIMPANRLVNFNDFGPYGYIPFIYIATKAIQRDCSPEDFPEVDEISLGHYFSKIENTCLEILNEDEIEEMYHTIGWE